jgi:hypothetical protein
MLIDRFLLRVLLPAHLTVQAHYHTVDIPAHRIRVLLAG